MTGRFVLADPSLIEFSGHCYEYLASLEAELQSRDIRSIWLGNRAMKRDIMAASGALPTFTYWCDARPVPQGVDPGSSIGHQSIRRTHERQIGADLEEADKQLRFNADDVLFINTLRHWPMRGVVDWAEKIGRERAPHVVLVLHFTAYPSPEHDDPSAAMYEAAFQRLEGSPLRDNFTLFADADELIAEYREMTKLQVYLVPIPHTTQTAGASARFKNDDRITIAYVGEARVNKGYHLLPHLINGIQRDGLASLAHFHVQSFTHDPTDPFYKQVMGRIDESNVTFFPDQLDASDYHDYLASADVILAPYLLDNYYKQTSGIFAEAIGMAKATIVPRGTWMASQVKHYGGGRLFMPDDPQSLLETTSDLIRNFRAVSEQASVAAEKWKLFHTSRNFIDIVMQHIGAADR
jgi:glycosyltransferase involved in cell wall biosynthesis